jgi:hypothetical protein
MRYINAYIHRGLNPRPHGSTPNPITTLLTEKKKFNFVVFGMKLFKKLKITNIFSFTKFI